ncbi:hypothetical protein F4776DRAFT_667507 [Hypoxylon sp. NC0597]|nr:hypothetical protein F4776DRAFT_667507 [Hypoxylon sp. NC0597]
MASENRSYMEELEARVKNMLETQKAKLPQQYPWDWGQLFQAVFEKRLRIMDNITPIEPSSSQAPSNPGHHFAGASEWRPQPIPKAPDLGGWDHVWYIPEWSHPDFAPDRMRTYTGNMKYIGTSDPLTGMRSALRPEDLAKNPSPWATRFGIHPDELGGRSRLSPTLAPSRDPSEDFWNQVNLLSEDERKEAVRLTRETAEQHNIKLPDEPDYIDPQIMEHLLSQHGLMSGDELKQNLQNVIGKDVDVPNLEVFVDELNARNPLIYKTHHNYLHKALKDQEFQRLVLRDWTSDEIVASKSFDMSNDVYCDLPDEIHPLFDRDRWVSRRHKGTTAFSPRFLYNLGGVREEWDVETNDRLWKALQPALRLATKVINSNHPVFQALLDLRTRQPVDKEFDQRAKPSTPFLTKIVPIDEMDVSRTYPEIRRLDGWRYSWPDNIMRVLNDTLLLDIGSCWIEPEKNSKGEVQESDIVIYGSTRIEGAREVNSTIIMNIAAEILWPLLIPGYSESEKMTASFAAASTILHEFAHAINYAIHFLTTKPSCSLEIDRDSPIGIYVRKLSKILWDVESSGGEHYWKDEGVTELGFTAETQLWGAPTLNTLNNYMLYSARYMCSLPLILEYHPVPMAKAPLRPGETGHGAYKNPPHPVENYQVLIPIGYMAKFFTQKFWNEDHQRYGPEALKMLLPDSPYKMTVTPTYIPSELTLRAFGQPAWEFVDYIVRFLVGNDFTILSEYISRAVHQALGADIFVDRWTHEVENWSRKTLTPLNESIERLYNATKMATRINGKKQANDIDKGLDYWNYVQEHQLLVLQGRAQGGTLMSQAQWRQRLDDEWAATFRIGGTLMRQMAETYRLVVDDVAHMERMLFDFFNLSPAARIGIYVGVGIEFGPIAEAKKRTTMVLQWVVQFAGSCEALSTYEPMAPIKDHWAKWGASFRSCCKSYQDLLDMLENSAEFDPNDNNWKKRFVNIPSSAWKSRYDRMQLVAQREYQRADPRIRAVVDECLKIINPEMNRFELPENRVESLMGAVKKANDLGKNINTVPDKNVFAWKAPAPAPPVIPGQAWQSSSAAFRNTAVSATGGTGGGTAATSSHVSPITFGAVNQMESLLERGTYPPARNAHASLGGGINQSVPSDANGNQGFRQWGQAGTAQDFVQVANQGMGAVDNVQAVGIASGSVNQIGGPNTAGIHQRVFGAPPPNDGGFSTTGFDQGQVWFPVPFANSITTTRDHQAHAMAQQQAAAATGASTNVQSGPAQPYRTARLWRERQDDDDDDDDESHRATTLGDIDNPRSYTFVP